ncbi:hypothetical protein HK100_005987 [Physocladia obscura]|uniref:Uncharacterized protein n=1 Tax=Physocladia obscura TaxID=109957 RepID=A0AAD5T5P3_9FUNG|nr:hypothetical protein HK100_005987 [Physocladia obscura]
MLLCSLNTLLLAVSVLSSPAIHKDSICRHLSSSKTPASLVFTAHLEELKRLAAFTENAGQIAAIQRLNSLPGLTERTAQLYEILANERGYLLSQFSRGVIASQILALQGFETITADATAVNKKPGKVQVSFMQVGDNGDRGGESVKRDGNGGDDWSQVSALEDGNSDLGKTSGHETNLESVSSLNDGANVGGWKQPGRSWFWPWKKRHRQF